MLPSILLLVWAIQPLSQNAPTSYYCPMHAEVISSRMGACPVCGMDLVEGNPLQGLEYDLRLQTTPAAVRAGEEVELRFAVHHPRTGELVRDFEIVHDKLYHLFIISQNLQHFFHVHPEQEEDGTFALKVTLPEAGLYKIYSDFLPKGGTPQVLVKSLLTSDFEGDPLTAVPTLNPRGPRRAKGENLQVTLRLEPEYPVAGEEALLIYRLEDPATGEPISDLEPYLGAWGHSLILSEDMAEYIHTHPMEMLPPAPERGDLKGGPEVRFRAFFPSPGNYRLWTQFQRGGNLSTFVFDLRVVRLGEVP